MSIKPILKIILQGLGAMLAFVFSLVIANMLSPLSPEIMAGKDYRQWISLHTGWRFFSMPSSML
ncbi:hypothetical protein [Candidatus Villigracilis affinis]|uniref:hypothetical protein n=1 Tax=Candidatus Villigracilis affinis TaxID=3140682 RepID=UPI002A2039E1|nr:hypothetical protein [Anaerolineales bacterium]